MPADVVELREFYSSPLGITARRLLRTHIGRLWPQPRGDKMAALGYGVPLLRPMMEQGAELIALMPAEQGVAYWPQEGQNISCFIDTRDLPLADQSLDRVVVMHAMEALAEPRAILPELWRVLKSNGRVIVIVPNRRGLWAHIDATPFGTGEPYSRAQITKALCDHGFQIDSVGHALYMPPSSSRWALSLADKFEKYGSRLFPGLGGVIIIEASKQLYAPILTTRRVAQRRFVLPLPSLPVSDGLPARVRA